MRSALEDKQSVFFKIFQHIADTKVQLLALQDLGVTMWTEIGIGIPNHGSLGVVSSYGFRMV